MNVEALQEWLQNNLRSMLPVVMIVLAVMGNLAFAATSIVPHWTTYESLTSRIDGGQQALAERDASSEDLNMADALGFQVEKAQADVQQAAAIFLTDEQANQMLNWLFGYAADSSVAISNLQAQQAPQTAPSSAYDARAFRLQAEGPMWNLLSFVARIREASVLSVSIQGVDVQTADNGAVLTMEIWFYASSVASGNVLDDLPDAPVPTPIATTEPEPTVDANSAAVVVETTSMTYLAAPLPLNPLYVDTFDAGVLYVWDVGPAWSFVPQGSGKALQVVDNNDPATFRYSTLKDAAVQLRFKVEGGSARLSLRQSEVGAYAGVIDPDAGEVRLYRGDVLVRSTALPPSAADGWYTVQLSAIDGIVRLVVDNVEYIAIRDLAQLPPGTSAFELLGGGSLTVDDFMLWTPE